MKETSETVPQIYYLRKYISPTVVCWSFQYRIKDIYQLLQYPFGNDNYGMIKATKNDYQWFAMKVR